MERVLDVIDYALLVVGGVGPQEPYRDSPGGLLRTNSDVCIHRKMVLLSLLGTVDPSHIKGGAW